jgi:hypothetical protein
MIYGLLADGVVALHFLWIMFLIFGGIWGRKHRTVRMVHIAGLAFALLLNIFGWYCPLTYLEVWLREIQDPSQVYAGSFIGHYLEKLVYIQLPPGTILFLTILIVLFNGWLYLPRKKR